MRALRWLILGFVVGAGVAFAVSLLRKRGLAQVTGYQAPEVTSGPSVSAAPPLVVEPV